jgi:hypothetical protein
MDGVGWTNNGVGIDAACLMNEMTVTLHCRPTVALLSPTQNIHQKVQRGRPKNIVYLYYS